MFELFKHFDVVDELDKNIGEDENLYAECIPNKIPFLFNAIKPYLFILFSVIVLDFIYALIKPTEINTFINIFEIFLICLNIVSVFFVLKTLVYAYSEVLNTYYVITDKGIHMTKGGKTLSYTLFLYTDLKSIMFNKYKMSGGRGDIIFRDITEKVPSQIWKKFLYRKPGLIGIDDAEQVYIVLKQIAIQENKDIFFADTSNSFEKVDYFQDVKKYANRIKVNKDDSVLDRRNK